MRVVILLDFEIYTVHVHNLTTVCRKFELILTYFLSYGHDKNKNV